MSQLQSTGYLIGITGATGAVGGKVAQRLAGHGIHQRLIVRDPDRAPVLSDAAVVQTAGYGDMASMTAALQGVHTLFLVSGHLSDDRVKEHKTAVDAALEVGVGRIVYLSFLNAAPDATFTAAREHYRTEEFIRASGAAFTFLRSGLYADLVPGRFGAADATLRGPAGDGRASYVTRADIVDTIVAALTGDGHNGKTYNMTGPEAITLADVAALLTEFSGRKCAYYDETLAEARQWRATYNVSDETVETWISSYTAIASSEMALVSDDVERLTGHRPRTFRDFLRQHPESYQHLIDGGKAGG